MEETQKAEVGVRIKQLRNASRETGNRETNRSIADYCDVSVEAVRNWIAGKGIAYENAVKVAELFGVDIDWLWRGRERQTPDLMAEFSRSDAAELREAVAALDGKLDRVLGQLAALAADVGKVQRAVQQAQPAKKPRGARRSGGKGK